MVTIQNWCLVSPLKCRPLRHKHNPAKKMAKDILADIAPWRSPKWGVRQNWTSTPQERQLAKERAKGQCLSRNTPLSILDRRCRLQRVCIFKADLQMRYIHRSQRPWVTARTIWCRLPLKDEHSIERSRRNRLLDQSSSWQWLHQRYSIYFNKLRYY